MFLAPLVERLLHALGWPAGWPMRWPAAVLSALVILGLAWLASWLAVRVVSRWARRLAARTATDLDDRIIDLADRPARQLIVLVGVYLAVRDLPLEASAERIFGGILYGAAVFVSLRLLARVVVLLTSAFGSRRTDAESKVAFEKDYLPLLSKLVGTVFAIVGLILVLRHLGQDVSSLVAALGVGGIAISFAAKETLGNMLAGFTILVDRPFRPGDRIKLASGEIGDVIEVGTRSTRLQLLDANMLIVPNNELVNSRVVNFNFPTHATRAVLEVGLAYGQDVDKAKELLLAVIKAQPEIVEPAPVALLAGFGDSALKLSASYTVSEFVNAGVVQDRVRVQVYKVFEDARLKMAFPTIEVHHRPVDAAPARAASK